MNKCNKCACLNCTCNNALYPCYLDKICYGCKGNDKNCKEQITELNCLFVAKNGRNTIEDWQLNNGGNKNET